MSDGDLRGEGDLDAVGVGHLAEHPLGEHHLICRVAGIDREELNLLLNHLTPVRNEVTDLRVRVLDRAAHANEMQEGFRSYILPLREGTRFVIPPLGFHGEKLLLGGKEVVLELPQGLQLAAGILLERALSLAQDLLWSRGKGSPVDIVEPAQDVEGGDRRKGVQERGRQARHDVQV